MHTATTTAPWMSKSIQELAIGQKGSMSKFIDHSKVPAVTQQYIGGTGDAQTVSSLMTFAKLRPKAPGAKKGAKKQAAKQGANKQAAKQGANKQAAKQGEKKEESK